MKTQDTYLISPSTVKAMTIANLNATDDVISYAIRNAQDMHLRLIIGDELLNSLKTKAEQKINLGKDIEEPYSTLLYDYIVPFLAAQSVVEACIPMTFKLRNIGVVRNTDTNADTQDIDNTLRVKAYYEGIACDAANRLADYLECNGKDFNELKNIGCRKNKHYAAIGLYLG